MNPFAVVAGGLAVGMTTFCDIDQPNRRVEIGYTWLSPTVQRTAVNTAAKRLLLGHAFEACDAIARYIAGYDTVAFAADAKTRDAVIRQFEIVGEAVKR